MRLAVGMLVALGACGGTTKRAAPPPPPPDRCAFVADHLLSLLTPAAHDAPTEELDRVRAQFNARCKEDGWSPAAQQCFLDLKAKEDVDQCASQLTEAQRNALTT